jgi:hypothetical protein
LEIIANPEHEEYKERMEWIGDELVVSHLQMELEWNREK